MGIEQVKELLDPFLNKKVNKEVAKGLGRFKEDEWLISDLEKRLGQKDFRQYSVDDFLPVIDILEGVVLADYPVENPVMFSRLYQPAISNGRVGDYGIMLNHLNHVAGIEKELVSLGVSKNENYGGKLEDTGRTDNRLYIYDPPCYMNVMMSIFREDSNVRQAKEDLLVRLVNFKLHIEELKQEKLDLVKLFSAGYANVIRELDAIYHNKDDDKFGEKSVKVVELLKGLDSKGFDVYNSSNFETISGWVKEGKIEQINRSAGYLSKEAFIYITNLRLKKD